MPFAFFLQHIYKVIRNVHNQKTQRHRESLCPQEGRATVREGCPFLSAPSPPRNAPASSTAAPSDSSRSLSWGRGKRQTDSNPSESGKLQVARRGGCSGSRGRFPELSRGQREEVGGQGETGHGGSGTARHPTLCHTHTHTHTHYPVLRDEKQLMGLAAVSLFSPGQDWEDADSGVWSKGQTG